MEVKEFHRGIMKKVTAQNVAEEIEVIKETYPPEGLLQSLGPLFDCLKWLEIKYDLLGVPWEEQELLVFNLAIKLNSAYSISIYPVITANFWNDWIDSENANRF